MQTLVAFLKDNNSKLKLITKLKVRDLDEVEPNSFVAYVDQNTSSFDVQIKLNAKKQLESTSCDCGENGVCVHIVALADFLKGQKKAVEPLKKTRLKKLSESDQLLENVSDTDLRVWVSELLNSNKEIAFLFKNNFSKDQIDISEEKLKGIIADCIKSVIGRRKTIQTSEVKKVVDAFQLSLKPYVEVLVGNPTQENLKYINCIATEIWKFYDNFYLNTTRIGTFITKIKEQYITNLLLIKDFDVWCERVDGLMEYEIVLQKHLPDFYYTNKVYEFSKTNELKFKFFLEKLELLAKPLLEEKLDWRNLNFQLKAFLLPIYIEHGLFPQYFSFFEPFKYENDFNLKLINALKAIGEIGLVEKYALAQITANYYMEYNIPYLKILFALYNELGWNEKQAELLAQYGKYVFDLNNYNFVKAYASDADFKKYRQGLLTNANNAIVSGDVEAFEMYYEIKKMDGKPEYLFELLYKINDYAVFNKYKEEAVALSEFEFLKAIAQVYNYREVNSQYVNEIIEFILQKYDKHTLKFYLRQFKSINTIIEALRKAVEA